MILKILIIRSNDRRSIVGLKHSYPTDPMDTMKCNALLSVQRKHFHDVVRHADTRERIEKLSRLKRWMMTRLDDIRQAVYDDFRKPAAEVDATETKVVVSEIDHAIENLHFWKMPVRVTKPLLLIGTRSEIRYEPKGVVLILAPWNFPFLLTVGPLVSAIAAGNCVVVKPSELTPRTSSLIHRMIGELFPENEIAVCEGDASVAEALLELPFDHIFFTGGTEIGRKVMLAAARHLTGVTLELGGCNPVIVDETADLKDTAEKLIWGDFMNNGQSCVSPNHIFVHRTIHEKFTSALMTAYRKLYGNNDADRNPDLGRVINVRHFHRIAALIDRTRDTGARVLLGGTHDESERFIHPTILDDVPWTAPAATEEIFGPVMAVLVYDRIDDVMEHLRSQPKPLCVYIFTRRRKNADYIVERTASGVVGINETTVPFSHPELPFGGVGMSGFGRAHGKSGFETFSNQRSILKQRRGWTTIKLLYPPYTARVRRLIEWAIRYF
jgi:aldehyde dehydrogenase (NAD+)